ncbi:MAG: single-stranded DNA-binding protein [Blastocatellia bacterium]
MSEKAVNKPALPALEDDFCVGDWLVQRLNFYIEEIWDEINVQVEIIFPVSGKTENGARFYSHANRELQHFTRQKKNGEGEKVSVADWYRITVFGRDAEIISQYAMKGSALSFNGRLQTDSYTESPTSSAFATFPFRESFCCNHWRNPRSESNSRCIPLSTSSSGVGSSPVISLI